MKLRLLWAALLMISSLAMADETPTPGQARIVLIIDDIGNRPRADRRALALPGPVTMAILPGTPTARRIARQAHDDGKTVMVHLPMQAYPDAPLGPYALRMDMGEQAFRRTVRQAIAEVPHAEGLNNHMGSLLTRHPGSMTWLMDELRQENGFFFVDSRTTAMTVTEQLALEHGVPWLRRHVFLDDDHSPEAVERQWKLALATAQRQGIAVVIGHPNAATLDMLERQLPLLPQHIRLVAPQEVLRRALPPLKLPLELADD